MDVHAELKDIFNIDMDKYDEAHQWWMSALEGVDDRLRDLERRVEVFAERYGTPDLTLDKPSGFNNRFGDLDDHSP